MVLASVDDGPDSDWQLQEEHALLACRRALLQMDRAGEHPLDYIIDLSVDVYPPISILSSLDPGLVALLPHLTLLDVSFSWPSIWAYQPPAHDKVM